MVLKLHNLSRLIYGGKVVNKVVVNTWHLNWGEKKSQPLKKIEQF